MSLTQEEAIRIARANLDARDRDLMELFSAFEEADYWCVSFRFPAPPGQNPYSPLRVHVDKATRAVDFFPSR